MSWRCAATCRSSHVRSERRARNMRRARLCMTGLVFVDTSVLLYAVDTRDASKHLAARDWMDRLWRERSGRTGVQVLSEFYVNTTRVLAPGLSREEAWDHVSALMEWNPQPVDARVLDLGHQIHVRHGLSWWDSLVVAAAHAQGCALLLTEDLQHGGVYSGVTALDPFRAAVQESRETYMPQIAAQPRRGRGRPRTKRSAG
ncbi:MAG: PIN domain-containing protein [Gammaproteobacteria bacterium]|nr:PIN domain-containing protein [Gammaproteobacteria bacterium]